MNFCFSKHRFLLTDYLHNLEHNLNCRALAPGVLDSDLFQIQTLQHLMRMSRTWDSTMSMIPKGGDTIWGGLDWSPEEGYSPSKRKQGRNDTKVSIQNESASKVCESTQANYGRMVSFGREVAEASSSEIERIEFRVRLLIPVKLSNHLF